MREVNIFFNNDVYMRKVYDNVYKKDEKENAVYDLYCKKLYEVYEKFKDKDLNVVEKVLIRSDSRRERSYNKKLRKFIEKRGGFSIWSLNDNETFIKLEDINEKSSEGFNGNRIINPLTNKVIDINEVKRDKICRKLLQENDKKAIAQTLNNAFIKEKAMA